jgi:hypothetical protein
LASALRGNNLSCVFDDRSHPRELAGRPHKEWFQNLQRPDNDAHPYRNADHKSLFCCGAADVVKTKFRIEQGSDKYPEDVWYAWLDDTWTRIPPEKIVKDFAPDEQAHLFVLAGTIQCFVRPKGGI